MAEGLPRGLPVRPVLMGKPHVHHERIRVIRTFNSVGAGLRLQSHAGKRHATAFNDLTPVIFEKIISLSAYTRLNSRFARTTWSDREFPATQFFFSVRPDVPFGI
jgi:hypothetical protein